MHTNYQCCNRALFKYKLKNNNKKTFFQRIYATDITDRARIFCKQKEVTGGYQVTGNGPMSLRIRQPIPILWFKRWGQVKC